MDNSTTVPAASEDAPTPSQEVEIIEIDLQNLSTEQKQALLVVLGSFVLQIVYLFGMGIVTGLLKIPIAQSFQPVADYVIGFLNTFIPYLIIVFLMVAIYVAYVLLLDDKDYFKAGLEVFNTVIKFLVLDFALYFVSLIIINPLALGQANPVYPNALELFIFIFMILLMVTIASSPFYVLDYLRKPSASTN